VYYYLLQVAHRLHLTSSTAIDGLTDWLTDHAARQHSAICPAARMQIMPV